jgi:hypothetical protein
MMIAEVEVRPASTRRDLKAFVKFPWRIYRGDPLWVPPLISDRPEQMNDRKRISPSTAVLGERLR